MTSADRPLLSVIVPVYNESEVIGQTYARLTAVVRAVPGFDYEIIAVDDGSSDGSYAAMVALASSDRHFRVLKLSRNFGHQTAITAGMDVARGDCVVLIDADLQDPPEVIPQMVAKWREGFDVVYGVRERREGESPMKKLTASLFYRLLSRLTAVPIPVDVGDFRLMSRRVTDRLKEMREKDRFVRGLVAWVGFPQTGVTYRRDARAAGDTKYPYRKMIKFAIDGLTGFSTVPLKAATWLGYLASAFAFIYLLSVFIQKWAGITVEGWATIMVAMLFMGGVQLVCIGILGEYLGRIFNEVKHRPLYVVEEFVNGDRAARE
jgi:glycosyltransferase involved in cell wall biosynthesis